MVKRTSSSLAITCCMFTLGVIVLFKKYKEPSQRMIANLAVASTLFSISFFITDRIEYQSTPLCKIQGAFHLFGTWVTSLWYFAIVLNLYLRVIFEIRLDNSENYVYVVCWTVPFVFMVLPFIDDVYGPAGQWCWIKNVGWWRFGIWYFWNTAGVFFFLFVLVHVTYTVKRRRRRRFSTTVAVILGDQEDLNTLKMYPLVMFIMCVVPLTARVQNFLADVRDQHHYNFTIQLLQAINNPLIGAAFALMFVLDAKTRRALNRKDIWHAIQRWRNRKVWMVREYPMNRDLEQNIRTEAMQSSTV